MQAILRLAFRTLFGLVLLCSMASSARSQELEYSVEGDEMTIGFDEVEGTPLDQFIKLCEKTTGLQLNYDTNDTKDVRLRFLGKKRLPRDQFWSYFQAVLKAYDFLVVPYGNVAAPGRPQEGPETGFFAIRKAQASGGGVGTRPGYIKSLAPVVTADQLESFKYDPGIVLTTSFTLKYVNVQEAANMLQTYFTDPMMESVRAVSNSNSLVATGYAQTLYAIRGLLTLIDTKPDEYSPRFAKIELQHAVAEEIQPIVKELIDAERGVARPGGGGGGGGRAAAAANLPATMQEPEPQVSADPRSNSLLVIAASQSLDKIVNYIRMLDVEVDPRGDTHVYRLKNSSAKDLEEILTEWAQNAGTGSSGGGGGGGGQAGGGGGSRGTLEQPITVVADESSNSLVITASKSRYAQILEIVKKLDTRRRQVLIESALVEISGTLDERLGVELGYVSVDDTPSNGTNRGFGVTTFGLSTQVDTDMDGIVDFRTPIGLSDGFSGTAGLTAGIFSGKDFGVPILVNALKTTSDSNILSMPSVLVNDNEEAFINSKREQPTFTTNLTSAGPSETFREYVEAGIKLNISPSISAGNFLRLLIRLEVSSFLPSLQDPPPKSTRLIESSVTLPNGHTMVIGGIVTDDQTSTRDGTPWLSELPLFGWLFRNNVTDNEQTNLYVFLTPHIISDDFATLDDLSYLKKKEMEALNGKIYLVDPDWDRDVPDTRVLDAGVAGVFDLPSYASPPGGEVDVPVPVTPTDANPLPSTYGEQPAEGWEDK